jgi:hypothetical protein
VNEARRGPPCDMLTRVSNLTPRRGGYPIRVHLVGGALLASITWGSDSWFPDSANRGYAAYTLLLLSILFIPLIKILSSVDRVKYANVCLNRRVRPFARLLQPRVGGPVAISPSQLHPFSPTYCLSDCLWIRWCYCC